MPDGHELSSRSGGELPRVCPECGTDRRRANRLLEWERRDLAKVRAAANKIAEENGRLKLRLYTLELEREEQTSGLRRKVARQAKALNRMEKRLRELGEKPYAGVDPDDAIAGAEFEPTPRDAVSKEMKY